MARPRIKPRHLWQVSVSTSLEAEDAVTELLTGIFHRAVAVYTNEETKITVASVYCPNRSDWNPATQSALRRGLAAIKSSGLKIGAGKILVRRVPREDWSESWKRHFKPLAIGPRLLIKPGWIKHRPRKNQAVVVLDPGLSFGTGNHPTTSFCLRQLVTHCVPGKSQSFYDIGTGSGILAIAAARLGYQPIRAHDFDPEAVRAALANARRNRVADRLRISCADLMKLPLRSDVKYDLICANLISNLLLAEKTRLLNRLADGGILVLAGILKKEFAIIQKHYKTSGLKLIAHRIEGEWQSGAFQRAS